MIVNKITLKNICFITDNSLKVESLKVESQKS